MTTDPQTAEREGAPAGTGSPFTRVLGILCLVGVAALLAFGLAWSPRDVVQDDSVRIMYLHVPAAWLSMMCWGVMTVAALGTLVWRHPLSDVAGKAAAPMARAWYSASSASAPPRARAVTMWPSPNAKAASSAFRSEGLVRYSSRCTKSFCALRLTVKLAGSRPARSSTTMFMA